MTLSALATERRPPPRFTPRRVLTSWSLAALTVFACGQPQQPTASPVDAAEEVAEELGDAEPYVPPVRDEPAKDAPPARDDPAEDVQEREESQHHGGAKS